MRRLMGRIRIYFVLTRARYDVDQSFFFFLILFLYMYFSQKPGYLFKKELHIERKSANRFIFVSLWLNCRFNLLESGVDRYFNQNCDVRFWREKQ